MRCTICSNRGHIIELAADSTFVARGLVKVRGAYICADCARDASAAFARVVKRICAAPEQAAEEVERL